MELKHALEHNIPIIRIVEKDSSHGGLASLHEYNDYYQKMIETPNEASKDIAELFKVLFENENGMFKKIKVFIVSHKFYC